MKLAVEFSAMAIQHSTSVSFHTTLRCLQQDGVVAYPTEGVFGLGSAADAKAACERIIHLKQRRLEQGMIVLASSWDQLSPWLLPFSAVEKRRLAQPPAAFITWIVAANKHVPPWLSGGRASLAVRIPCWQPLLELCQAFGRPITSTSANPHGETAATTAAQVLEYFPQGIDALWDFPCAGEGRPSSIYRLSDGVRLR